MRLAEKVFNLFCKSMSARALMICVNVGKWVRNGHRHRSGGQNYRTERACINTIMCPPRLSMISFISIQSTNLVGESRSRCKKSYASKRLLSGGSGGGSSLDVAPLEGHLPTHS